MLVGVVLLGVGYVVVRPSDSGPKHALSWSDLQRQHGATITPRILVRFQPTTTDADLGNWPMKNVMDCGSKGCRFRAPFFGADTDYTHRTITLELGSAGDIDGALSLVRSYPLVLSAEASQ